MLKTEVLDKLVELKFTEAVINVLHELANEYEHDLLISPNKYEPVSRLNQAFGVVYKVKKSEHDEIKEKLIAKLPSNYSHYEVHNNTKNIHIAVIRPTDKYELIRIMGTNGEENYGLDTGTLLARLRRWEEEYELELHGAGPNWIKFKLKKIPGELRDFVEELLKFAPGTEADIKDLEEQIRTNKAINVYW